MPMTPLPIFSMTAALCFTVAGAPALLAQAAAPPPPPVVMPSQAPAAGAPAQEVQPAASATPKPGSQAPDPRLQLSPQKALEQFEPGANEEYALGPGDEITLEFAGHPELASKHMVGPDGRITLPMAGPVDVNNKTRAQVGSDVAKALEPYYKDLAVTVRVDKYGSNRVVILGNVQHPGVLYFDETPSLLDAIARAGLVVNQNVAPNVTGVAHIQDGIPERVAIYRGNDQVVWVQLRDMLNVGNPMADMRLRRNDLIFVPAQQEVYVSVLGSVQHPGAIALTSESTLASVLAQAGGMAEGAGAVVQIVQPTTGKTLNIPFKRAISLDGSKEVTLHSGDIVYVAQSGFYRSTYVVNRLSPFAAMGTFAAIAF